MSHVRIYLFDCCILAFLSFFSSFSCDTRVKYISKQHDTFGFFLFYLLVVLVLALALGPVQPASDIVPHVLIPLLVGDLGRRGRTPAGTAEKDNVLLWLRLGEGEFLKKKKKKSKWHINLCSAFF